MARFSATKYVSAALVVAAMAVACLGGYRAILQRHAEVDLQLMPEAVSSFPVSEGNTWVEGLERIQGEPLVEVEPGHNCTESECFEVWHLIPADWKVLDSYSADVTATIYGIRRGSRAEASIAFRMGYHRGWQPIESLPHQQSTSWKSRYADQVRLVCFSQFPEPDYSRDCVWSYYARYGQYVFGLKYSAFFPTSLEEFVEYYVAPFDEHVADLLGLR
jgi:hypothetical protein